MNYKLPEETYRVFPSAYNSRNTYDKPTNVKLAIGQRKRYSKPEDICVFRAKTVWVDVTDEFMGESK